MFLAAVNSVFLSSHQPWLSTVVETKICTQLHVSVNRLSSGWLPGLVWTFWGWGWGSVQGQCAGMCCSSDPLGTFSVGAGSIKHTKTHIRWRVRGVSAGQGYHFQCVVLYLCTSFTSCHAAAHRGASDTHQKFNYDVNMYAQPDIDMTDAAHS